jgi:hypothetical protein
VYALGRHVDALEALRRRELVARAARIDTLEARRVPLADLARCERAR